MNNAPLKVEYKKSVFSQDAKKVESLEKQLHFLESRVNELEACYLDLIEQDEMADDASYHGSDSEDSCHTLDEIRNKKK